MTAQPQDTRKLEIQQKAAKIAAEVSQAYANARILFGEAAAVAIAHENVRMQQHKH